MHLPSKALQNTLPLDRSKNLSVIVPSRNECDSIAVILNRIRTCLPAAEVIVVDASEDATAQKVSALQADWSELKLIQQERPRGKGAAIRLGIAAATRTYIAQIDSDLQFDPEDLLMMIDRIDSNETDFICGSRFSDSVRNSFAGTITVRSIGNWAINSYTRLIVRHPHTDILAGIKMWRREVTESFPLLSNDFCYEAELPIKAERLGFRVMDVPVKTNARLYGKSKVPVFRIGWRLLIKIPSFALTTAHPAKGPRRSL